MQGNPTPTPESIGLITGATGLAVLATATQAEALAAIGAEQEIEMITNANGTAWRFPRIGKQICTFETAETYTSSGFWAGGIYINYTAFVFNFPAVFSDIPIVSPSIRGTGIGNQILMAMTFNITSSAVQLSPVGVFSNATGYIGYIAFGDYSP